MIHEILRLDYRIPETQRILSFDDLGAFYSTCFKAEYGKFLDVGAMVNVETWLEGSIAEDMVAIEHSDTITLASMRGSEVLGTAVYAERLSFVYLWAMYVHPDNLRSGIGSKLLTEVANSVARDSRIEVSVIKQSAGAMNFYNKFGFRRYKLEESEVFPGVILPIEVMQTTTKSIRGIQF